MINLQIREIGKMIESIKIETSKFYVWHLGS